MPTGKPFGPNDGRINKGGRPPSFGKRIRELTADGEELVQIALSVARGTLSIMTPMGKDAVLVAVLPSAREVLEAVKWLKESGWGKAREAEAETELTGLTDDELAEAIVSNEGLLASIDAARARVKATAPGSGALQ